MCAIVRGSAQPTDASIQGLGWLAAGATHPHIPLQTLFTLALLQRDLQN